MTLLLYGSVIGRNIEKIEGCDEEVHDLEGFLENHFIGSLCSKHSEHIGFTQYEGRIAHKRSHGVYCLASTIKLPPLFTPISDPLVQYNGLEPFLKDLEDSELRGLQMVYKGSTMHITRTHVYPESLTIQRGKTIHIRSGEEFDIMPVHVGYVVAIESQHEDD